MNNKDQRVQKIEKNAFEYYAYSKIVVPIPFVYLKNVEFLKQQGSEEHMLLQCCQWRLYLLTDPASNFFFSHSKYFHCTDYMVRYKSFKLLCVVWLNH